MSNHKIRNAEHGKIAAIYLLSAYCFEIPRHWGETWAKPRLTR